MSAAERPELLLTHAYFLGPDRRRRGALYPLPPLQPAQVAAWLREKASARVELWDSTFRRGPSSFEVAVSRVRPAAVWIYTHPTTRLGAQRMLSAARRCGAAVLVSGPDSDLNPLLYLEAGADIVVPGDRMEAATLRALLALRASHHRFTVDSLAQVPGAVYLDDAYQLCSNGGRVAEIPLDELPWPEREPVQTRIHLGRWLDHRVPRSLALSSSRGCPLPCGFCSNSVFGRAYRRRSPESVVAEMRTLADSFAVDRLVFADEVFLFDGHWLAEFAACLSESGPPLAFEGSAHPGALDPASLSALVEAGLVRVELDAASGSDSLLRNLEWGYSPSDIYRAVADLRSYGLEVGLKVLVGLPGEGRADLDATLEMVQIIAPAGVEVCRADPNSPALFRKDWQRVIAGPVFEAAARLDTLPGPVLDVAAEWMSQLGRASGSDPFDQASRYLHRLRIPALRALLRALPSWPGTAAMEWKRRRRLPGPARKP